MKGADMWRRMRTRLGAVVATGLAAGVMAVGAVLQAAPPTGGAPAPTAPKPGDAPKSGAVPAPKTDTGSATPKKGGPAPKAATKKDEAPKLPPGVHFGPGEPAIGSVATVKVPAGWVWLDQNTVRDMERKSGSTNPQSLLGVEASDEEGGWLAVFEFSNVGYVKDDDKADLANKKDELLENFRGGIEAQNEQRKKMGLSKWELLGWAVEPKYDEKYRSVVWAIKFKDLGDGKVIVNYITKILGRGGVMETTLICAPDQLEANLPRFHKFLEGFAFNSGQKYEEYRPGDKVAEYGLYGLVAAGAGVALLKTGLLQKFGKLIFGIGAAIVIGIGAAFKWIWQTITGTRPIEEPAVDAGKPFGSDFGSPAAGKKLDTPDIEKRDGY